MKSNAYLWKPYNRKQHHWSSIKTIQQLTTHRKSNAYLWKPCTSKQNHWNSIKPCNCYQNIWNAIRIYENHTNVSKIIGVLYKTIQLLTKSMKSKAYLWKPHTCKQNHWNSMKTKQLLTQHNMYESNTSVRKYLKFNQNHAIVNKTNEKQCVSMKNHTNVSKIVEIVLQSYNC